MFAQFRLTTILAAGALALGLSSVAQGQIVTDVNVLDGAGNTLASGVRSFDESQSGSGLAVGFTPVEGTSFTFLYQANVVGYDNAAGQAIAAPGLNESFASGGYEFTVVASITETVTGVAVAGDGTTTVTFSTTGGTASIFYDSTAAGGAQSVTSTGVGFDDGTLVGTFNVVAGSGFSNFTTFPSGVGGGFTAYDFIVSPTGLDASYIDGVRGPINDLHFTSSQVLPPGNSTTSGFHMSAPSDGNPDIYASTATGGNLLLKVDGSNTFTTAIPEPETYALMLAGLGALGFMTRRRRRQV
jgi:hypothetical protein